MHPVDQRQRLLLEHLGCRDIGEDHELLDQLVRVEPVGHDDAVDRAVGLEQDLALGQIEIERIALVARALDAGIGGIKRPQDWIEQGPVVSSGLPSIAACACA